MHRNLTILQINDTHGYLEPHPELVWTPQGASYPLMGGYARIATLFKQARRENPGGVIALDNGDTFHGTYPAVISKGEALVPLVNELQLDAMTAHWEFAWGPQHFMEMTKRINHPMLAINCYDKKSGERPFPSSILVERAGLRVAVIGIAATIIDKSMPSHFSEGIRFTLGIDELPAEIERLRSTEATDLIVVLSHLGFPQDVKLASTVDGIDLIVSGHTHNRLEKPVKIANTLIIQSGCHGSFIGRLDLTIEGPKVAGVRHKLIPVDDTIVADPEMAALVESVLAPHRSFLAEVVGSTVVGLHRGANLYSPMDDILLAAVAMSAQTDIAFSNGWRYGAPIRPGPVTVNDLWNIIPTNPRVSTMELKGAEIREMMEVNLERTFSSEPFEQMGGYIKRFCGLTIYGKLENPPGFRVEHIFTEKGPVGPEQYYEVAFLTAQGVPEHLGRNRRDLPVHAICALQAYLALSSEVKPGGVGRFILV